MRKRVSVEGYMTVSECGEYGHVTRQAVNQAIKKGLLPYTTINDVKYVTKEDYDAFRESKFTPRKVLNGKPLFDFEEGRYSVSQVAKIFSDYLGRRFPPQRIYYLIRTGRLVGFRTGATWVIQKEDAVSLLKNELARELHKSYA